MLLLLILPVLAAGYLIVSQHPFFAKRLHRYDGQLLYLITATQGLYCSGIAVIAVTLMDYYLGCGGALSQHICLEPQHLNQLFPLHNPSQFVWILYVSIAAIIVAKLRIAIYWLLAKIKYQVINFGNANQSKLPYQNLADLALTQEIINDSPLDKLLFQSFVGHSPVTLVMLSMDDNKVYVGKVIEMGEPTETEGMDQEILIEPTRSGYRNKDTKIVTFTTYYDKIEGSSAIVLKQDKIISATLFNEQIYRDFQALHKAEG